MAATAQPKPRIDPVVFMPPENFAAMILLSQTFIVQEVLARLTNAGRHRPGRGA